MSEDERCRGRKGGSWRWLKERSAAGGRRSAEAEEAGEKKKAKDKEIVRRATRERERKEGEKRKRERAKETVGREGGKTLHEGLEM